ncbi:hypothetical protein V6X63_09695 [Spiribacter sp. 221]|uniref:hypothetical protein n=1 Tax=Spiribacter onubensis TaxID=3122420 RepID=UPI00349FA981
MLKTVATPSLRAIWLGRQPRRMHSRLLLALRRDLSIIHAAVSIDDLALACGDRLEPLADESIPFDDPAGVDAAEHAAGETGMYSLDVGYGWRLHFQFHDGEAHGVRLEEHSR